MTQIDFSYLLSKLVEIASVGYKFFKFFVTIGFRNENFLREFDWFSAYSTVLLQSFLSFHIKGFNWLSSILYQKNGEDVICSYLYIRWVGRNYSEELCLSSLSIFSTCCHRATHTGSFWNWSWKPIFFTLWYRKRELFGLSLSWECFTCFIIMKSSKNVYCMPASCVTIPFSFFFSHP